MSVFPYLSWSSLGAFVRTAALRPIWLKIEWRASAAAYPLALEYSRSRVAADERAMPI
jgi:hypothetical protein